jgi:TolB-like protein/Flp pilus assembly protein TadD
MSASVFLSYSREDQAIARKLVAALEKGGCSVWWDALLESGERFSKTTEAALDAADVVVVLWSKTSVDSHWVHDEATRGRDRGRLVPASIDGALPPLGFGQFQALDMSHWKGKAKSAEIEQLLRAIATTSGRPQAQRSNAMSSATPNRRNLIIGSGALLVAAGGGYAIWRSGSFGGKRVSDSVAVMPFRNLSDDAEQDYFAALSRNPELRVLAPTSTATAKDQIADLRAVAKKLSVAFVLSGTVRQSADVLRITASLVDGQSGEEDWRQQFDKPIADIFQIQGDIADSVASALSAQTADGAANPKVMGGTSKVKAYDAYLRGNAFYALRSGEAAYRSALKQYDAALAIDPNYAQAHAARARVITVITNSYAKASEFKASYDEAVASAKRAVAIAPKLAITQSTLGFVLVQGRLDLRGARLPYETSYKLGRGDATVQLLYAAYAAEMGWQDKALVAINRAVELDPFNAGTHRAQAFVHYCARRFDDAITACNKALALNPKLSLAHAYWGDALFHKGAVKDAQLAYGKESDQMTRLTGLAIVHHKLGDTAAAASEFASLIKEFGDGSTYQQAQIFAQWDRADEAMQKLTLARQIGDVGLAYAGTDPCLDPLRKLPEFYNLLKDLGFE